MASPTRGIPRGRWATASTRRSITLGGAPLDPAGRYRVTVNSFLADGGDGFTVLTEGAERLGGVLDLDAFEAYLRANAPVTPGPRDRIRREGTTP